MNRRDAGVPSAGSPDESDIHADSDRAPGAVSGERDGAFPLRQCKAGSITQGQSASARERSEQSRRFRESAVELHDLKLGICQFGECLVDSSDLQQELGYRLCIINSRDHRIAKYGFDLPGSGLVVCERQQS